MSEYKTLDAAVKEIGEGDGSGTWTAVISSDATDRDGEVIVNRAFDPLPHKLPVHDRHFGSVIGSGHPYYVGGELWFDGTFASAPLAQNIRSLVTEGHLTTMSVAFLPQTDKRVDGVRHVTKGELLSVDWAAIPSNRESRLVSVRSMNDDVDAELRASRAYFHLRAELGQLDAELTRLQKRKAVQDKEASKRAWKMARELLAEERAKEAAAEALKRSIEHDKRNPSRWVGPGFDRLMDGTRIDVVQMYVPDRSPNVDPECTAPNIGYWEDRNKWVAENDDPGWETLEDRRRRLLAPAPPAE